MSKLIVLLMLVLLILTSCGKSLHDQLVEQEIAKKGMLTPQTTYIPYGIHIVKVDSCQYILAKLSNGISIIHKQNCNNGIHSR